MGELLTRRRELMLPSGGGTKIETWVDISRTAEGTSLGSLSTAPLPTAVRTAMLNGSYPSRIYVRFYPVTPTSGTINQSARLCLWRDGVGIVYNFVNSTSNSGRSFKCSDGTELAMEAVLELTDNTTPGYYKVTWSTNDGGSGTRSSSSRLFVSGGSVPANMFFTVRSTSSTNFGIGTRLVVIAEYDN